MKINPQQKEMKLKKNKNKLAKLMFALLTTVALLMATDCATNPTVTANPWRGANMAGGEISWAGGSSSTFTNPVSGTNYIFPTTQDIDYAYSKNIGFIRLTFSMELMQTTLNGTLTPNVMPAGSSTWSAAQIAYSSNFQNTVSYATAKGMTVLVEVHGGDSSNFFSYKGSLIGSSGYPATAFANFWGQMGTLFKSNSKVALGLGNEPHDMSTTVLFNAEQLAITSIRQSGFTGAIFVEGNCWTAASSWTSASCDSGSPQIANSTAFMNLKDPNNNIVAEIHEYFDQDQSGQSSTITDVNTGVTQLTPVINWAKSNSGVKIHVSEFGAAASSPLAVQTLTNFYNLINANQNIVIGGSFWTDGNPSFWSSYFMTLSPSSNYTKDSPQLALLTPFLTSGTVISQDAGTTMPVDSGLVSDSGSTTKPTDAGIVQVDSGSVSKDAGVTDAGTVSKDAGSPDSGTTVSGASSLVVTSATISNSATQYCKEFTFTNNTKSSITWSSMELNMQGGKVLNQANGTMNIWNVGFSSATGVPTITATTYKTIGVGKGNNSLTWGFCASYATSGQKWTATEVVGSLK